MSEENERVEQMLTRLAALEVEYRERVSVGFDEHRCATSMVSDIMTLALQTLDRIGEPCKVKLQHSEGTSDVVDVDNARVTPVGVRIDCYVGEKRLC